MRLAIRLTAIMLAAVFVSISAIGFFSFITTRAALEESIGANQQELAKETMDKIDRLLHQKYQEIQVIADANPIEDIYVSQASYANQDLIARSEAATRKRLDEFLLQTGPWDTITLVYKDGSIIISTFKGTEAKSIKDYKEINAAFNAALEGEVYYSDLIISEKTLRPTLIFAAPVRKEEDPGRPVVGAVVAEFSWPVILEIIDEIKTGNAHLFNKDGITIATHSTQKEEILKHDLEDLSIVQQALQGKCSSSILSQEETNRPSLSSCSLQDGHLGYKGRGWGLFIETPQDVAFAAVNALTKRFLIIGIIIALLFIPITFLLSNTISRPITRLKSSADKISKGFLTEPIDVKGKNEISELANSLDNMRYSLKLIVDEYESQRKISDEMKEKLEMRVREKTKDIASTLIDFKTRSSELQRFSKLSVGREQRMIELKKRAAELEKQLRKCQKKGKKN
jgi:HAMP domain-containing protein